MDSKASIRFLRFHQPKARLNAGMTTLSTINKGSFWTQVTQLSIKLPQSDRAAPAQQMYRVCSNVHAYPRADSRRKGTIRLSILPAARRSNRARGWHT